MGFFSRTAASTETILVVDIGSGSVGLALVVSRDGEAQPEILWTHREYSLIKEVASATWSLREINTAIINAFLKFNTDGLRVLTAHPEKLSIETLQLTISAPWTYTITKTINYSEATPFTVTDSLVEELADTANKKAMEAALEHSMLTSSGLVTIETKTIGIMANEYILESFDDVKTTELSLMELTAMTHQRIIETIEEVRGKIMPRATLRTHSFMAIFYDFMRRSFPDTTECCMIDVTSEATEIGIIRDNILRHTTHAAEGAYTLAREIAALSKIPKEEAYAYLRGGEAFVLQKLSDAKQAELAVIIETYEEKIADLLRQTGDTLAVPKTIYLHCDADSEAFFIARLANAAKRATGMVHSIHPVTSTFLKGSSVSHDTAILLSAAYVHAHREELIR
jgi:hypothetical protein